MRGFHTPHIAMGNRAMGVWGGSIPLHDGTKPFHSTPLHTHSPQRTHKGRQGALHGVGTAPSYIAVGSGAMGV
jgi:hypothetical protein